MKPHYVSLPLSPSADDDDDGDRQSNSKGPTPINHVQSSFPVNQQTTTTTTTDQRMMPGRRYCAAGGGPSIRGRWEGYHNYYNNPPPTHFLSTICLCLCVSCVAVPDEANEMFGIWIFEQWNCNQSVGVGEGEHRSKLKFIHQNWKYQISTIVSLVKVRMFAIFSSSLRLSSLSHILHCPSLILLVAVVVGGCHRY